MRIRRMLAAALFASLPLIAVPGVAHASGGEGVTIGECNVEETKKAAQAVLDQDKALAENLVEDCFSSKSPIIPKWSEVIWGGIAWLIVMLALVKFALPALKKTMQAREDRIRGDLESAATAKSTAEAELAQYRAQLADARTEASRIIEEARQAADQVRNERLAVVETEADELRARAQEDIRLASERAMADLRGQVASMSIELAEKIVERNLDASTQQALIDSYIAQVGKN